jgi:hypothetical protein
MNKRNKKKKKTISNPGIMVSVCNLSYLGVEAGGLLVQVQPGKKLVRSYLKNKIQRKGWGGMSQVLECILSKHEAVGSIPSSAKKKKKHKKEEERRRRRKGGGEQCLWMLDGITMFTIIL